MLGEENSFCFLNLHTGKGNCIQKKSIPPLKCQGTWYKLKIKGYLYQTTLSILRDAFIIAGEMLQNRKNKK